MKGQDNNNTQFPSVDVLLQELIRHVTNGNQRQFAKRIGVSPAHINNVLRNNGRGMSYERLGELAAQFGYNLTVRLETGAENFFEKKLEKNFVV